MALTPPLKDPPTSSEHDRPTHGAQKTTDVSDREDALPGESEVLGQSAPNQQYLGQRLLYHDGEAESLDPLSWRVVKALFVHWLTLLALSIVGTIVIFAVFGPADLHVAGVLAGVFGFVLSIVLWWGPVWVPISEWKFMLDGKGEVASSAFEHSASAFRGRRTPVTPCVQRILLGRGASRDYLYVQDGIFRGYLVAFPYGRDLYVGWTYWWRVSAVHWLWIGVTRIYQHLTLRGSQLHAIHRYDGAKALREAIHGAAREGLDAASGSVPFQGKGTVGSDLRIEEVGQVRGVAKPHSSTDVEGANPFSR